MSKASEWAVNIGQRPKIVCEADVLPGAETPTRLEARLDDDGGMSITTLGAGIMLVGGPPQNAKLKTTASFSKLSADEALRLAHWILDTFGESPVVSQGERLNGAGA